MNNIFNFNFDNKIFVSCKCKIVNLEHIISFDRISFLLLRLEWLQFLHVKSNRLIGNPQVSKGWDRGYLISRDCIWYKDLTTGEHTICDINGNSLKLRDVKSGMFVKIRAKKPHWGGYSYLYTADGLAGMYFEIWIIKIRQ